MVVGTAKVELLLHGVQSLKDKRSIVRRVVSRVRNNFEISAAETGSLDSLKFSEIGLAVVTNDSALADSIIKKAVNYIIDLHLAEVGRAEVEVTHF